MLLTSIFIYVTLILFKIFKLYLELFKKDGGGVDG